MRRLWIPNVLTGLRFLLLPAVIVLLRQVDPGAEPLDPGRLTVVGLFFLLAVTDWFDGYLARRLEATSRWGSVADAAADRLALLLPLLCLAVRPHGAFPEVPLWIPLWLLALDAAVGLAWWIGRGTAGVDSSVSHTTVAFAHTAVGRLAVWILFALVLWILGALPFPGVIILGLSGLTLATASAIIHIRRWLGTSATRR